MSDAAPPVPIPCQHPPLLIRAEAMAAMDGRGVLRGDVGVLVADGLIVAAGHIGEATFKRSMERLNIDEDSLGRAVLLPGLVNAHAHLELSHCTPGDRPASFVDWITSLPRRTGRGEADFDARVAAAASEGARQSARFGVTCVGDITAHPHLTRPALRDGPVRVVSYGEALGLAGLRTRFEQSLVRAIDESAASETLAIGLSPHAPYTVDLPGYHECLTVAAQRGLPIATHRAETADEDQFIRRQSGAFRDVWERLGSWAEGVETFDGSPVQFAGSIGLLDSSALLAHVNYCDDGDLDLLAAGNASVVYCPRTHDYFGHPPHRWREMLSRGVNVAIGTDSCASSPDLNVVDDLRLLRRRHHDVDTDVLWSLVTDNAARAVRMQASAGAIAAGLFGDVVAFPLLDRDDPLAAILDEPGAGPLAVWVAGRRVV